MNRKQWLVLGFGLILMGILFGFVNSGYSDGCDQIIEGFLGSWDEIQESEMTSEELQTLRASYDVIDNCLNTNLLYSTMNSILWSLGIIFVIIGFLEKKKSEYPTQRNE